MSYPATGLKGGATYYWKLRAQPKEGAGFSTETITYRFTTEG